MIRAQEEAYFFKVNSDLIESIRRARHYRANPKTTTRPKIEDTKQKGFYEFLEETLQPNEHWQNNISF